MTDTILEKDTLTVLIGDDHSFACSAITLGRTGEHGVSQLEITIPEELNNFWAYLDFKKSNGDTVKTPRLDIVNNKIEYDIPQGLLDVSGNIEVQLVLESEKGEVWKSSTKKFVVLKSIDAGGDIPEAESFISEAQKILDETVETTNAFIAEAKEENEAFKEEIEKTTDDFIAESNKKIDEALVIRDGYASGIIKAVSGKAVSLTDISPFKHTLGVKARSKNTYIADFSTAKVLSYEKNLYDNSTIEDKADATATGYQKYKIILPNGTYTWSLQENNFIGSNAYAVFTDDKDYTGASIATGCFVSWIGHSSASTNCKLKDTFTVTKGYVYLAHGGAGIEVVSPLLETMQIEAGTEATPFEAYTEPTPHSINADGTVEGVTSTYPTTTLIPDTDGVVLDVEYYADTKKYIDNIKAELQALILEG